MDWIPHHAWVLYHTLHLSNVVQKNNREKAVWKLMFQLALSDLEDQDRELRENQASVTVEAQLYNQNEKRGRTGIGTGTKNLAKITSSKWSDIPYWPKEALEQHGKEDRKRKS